MQIVFGRPEELPYGFFTGLMRYRHRVFVELLGWPLQCRDGLERDQFDRSDTQYVVAHDGTEIVGTARLLPTTRPYLLADVFPQLLGSEQPPASPDVWELSRFAAVDFRQPSRAGRGQFSSPIAVALLSASLDYAAMSGAQRVITVSPAAVERLLAKAGFRAHRAGPPQRISGQSLFACSIDCSELPGELQTAGDTRLHTLSPSPRSLARAAAC